MHVMQYDLLTQVYLLKVTYIRVKNRTIGFINSNSGHPFSISDELYIISTTFIEYSFILIYGGF